MQKIIVANDYHKERELLDTDIYRRISSDVMEVMLFGEKPNQAELDEYMIDLGEVILISNHNLIVDPNFPVQKLMDSMETYNRDITVETYE